MILSIEPLEVTGKKKFLLQVQAVHEKLLDGLDYTEINHLQADPIVLKAVSFK